MWPFPSSYPEVPPSAVDGKTYDYIVVGGGTSGCAVASRLSEDPKVSVLVLEKGFSKDSLLSRIPLLSQNFLFGDKLQVVSDRFSEPSPEVNGGRLKLWTAEGLGGASRINAMVMTRGPPGDYNAWAQEMSLHEWAWDGVEPFFRKSENNISRPQSEARGHDGPIKVTQIKTPFAWGPYIEKAAQAIGLPIVDDVNDPAAPAMGFYRLDQAVNEKSERSTSYQSYLNKSIAYERQSHLTVCTGAIVSRLKMNDAASSVRGVFIRSAGILGEYTKDVYVEARREVIVCCGALKTAQLLMLSGIGPRAPLEAVGVPVLQELPVGQSLADHFAVPIMLDLPKSETMHKLESLFYGLWHMLLYLFFKSGLLTSSCMPSTIFVRSGSIDDRTMDIQVQAINSKANFQSDTMDISQPQNVPDIEVMLFGTHGFKRHVPGRSLFTLYTCLVQPHSEGRVELLDSDPRSHPRVTHPILRSQRDWPVARKAIRFTMRLAQEFLRSGYPYPAQIAFAPGNQLQKLIEWELTAEEEGQIGIRTAPKPAVQTSEQSKSPLTPSKQVEKTWETVTDDEIDRYVRSVATVSLHPSCTCRMSNDAQSGVVDQRLRVHGVRKLRIADTSVFPRMLSCHTMWPAIMVAERCAEFIKQDWRK
ncbi:hypothetical protein N0V82_005104 [Gnomoniopsis sp. IMI 355080]|nr:hypothetical protein N0V82_005104 [Gnomoniopsis sp. IMI 355080]